MIYVETDCWEKTTRLNVNKISTIRCAYTATRLQSSLACRGRVSRNRVMSKLRGITTHNRAREYLLEWQYQVWKHRHHRSLPETISRVWPSFHRTVPILAIFTSFSLVLLTHSWRNNSLLCFQPLFLMLSQSLCFYVSLMLIRRGTLT